MKIYTVYTNPKAREPLETANFVPEAFNYWALVFPFNAVWAITNRCWLFLIIALAFVITGFMADEFTRHENLVIGCVKLAILPFMGIWANDFRRSSLRRRGYQLAGIVTGKDETEAQLRYYDSLDNLLTEKGYDTDQTQVAKG